MPSHQMPDNGSAVGVDADVLVVELGLPSPNTGGVPSKTESAFSGVDVEGGNKQVGGGLCCDTPVSLEFATVEAVVTLPPATSWLPRAPAAPAKKEILHGVSGAVHPGELLALMGPSGSGKTTLLNVLGGRRGKMEVAGRITYSGMEYHKSMKRQMGFVTQDDTLYAHLTVHETLLYAALLRLPKQMTRVEKLQRCEGIISELGLTRCRDTVIGNMFMQGISGGERKRVSIGHEMLINPALLFLDEPTSGLDSTTALKILSTLVALAAGGRTIVTTIHQPSSRMYSMFDKLLLLAEGHCIYYGRAGQAMAYFASVGYEPAFPTNPADFLLDLATGEGQARDPAVVREELRGHFARHREPQPKEMVVEAEGETQEAAPTATERRKWSASWLQQFSILTVRGLKERRYEAWGGLRLTNIGAVALICALLWWQQDLNTEGDIRDMTGFLFFCTIFWGFFPLFSALFTFPEERVMLSKERASGMYRLSAYFFARTLGDLPLELVMPTVFAIITYWSAGLRPSAAAFVLHLLVLLLNVLVAQSLGLAIGALIMNQKRATVVASVLMLSFLLAGGYYVQNTPSWISWVKYLSFSLYTYELLIKVEFRADQTYSCPGMNPLGRCLVAEAPALKNVDLVGGRTAAADTLALIVMLVGFRALSYMALRRLNKGGRQVANKEGEGLRGRLNRSARSFRDMSYRFHRNLVGSKL